MPDNDYLRYKLVQKQDDSQAPTPDKPILSGLAVAISKIKDNQIIRTQDDKLALYTKGTYINCDEDPIYFGESIVTCDNLAKWIAEIEKLITILKTEVDIAVTRIKKNITHETENNPAKEAEYDDVLTRLNRTMDSFKAAPSTYTPPTVTNPYRNKWVFHKQK